MVSLTPEQQAIHDAKQGKLGTLLGNMPNYQDVGLDNSNVQGILGSLNDQTNLTFNDLLTATNNQTAGNREYGSSFEATRQGKLTSEYAKQKAQNILSALAQGSQLQTQNMANNIGMASYLGTNISPVFDPNSFMKPYADINQTGTANTISDMLGLTNSSGNQNSVTTQSGGLGTALMGMMMAGLQG